MTQNYHFLGRLHPFFYRSKYSSDHHFVLNTCTYFGCYPWNENTWHIIQDVKHGHFFTAEIPTNIQQGQSQMERLGTGTNIEHSCT